MLNKTVLKVLFMFVGLAGLIACGNSSEPSAAVPMPTLSAEAQLGKTVFTRECSACHSLIEETVIVGPPITGIASRAETRVPGQDAETYLLAAILRPGEHLVEGYQDLMPTNFGKRLTGEELDALVAYMLTLE